jgi:gliding motility-associated-like protein
MLVGFAGKGQIGNIGGNGGKGGAGGKGGNAAAIVGNGSIGTCSSNPDATQVINGVTYRCHSGCYMGAGGNGGKGSDGGKGGDGGKGSDGVASPFFQNFAGDAVIVTNQAVSFEPKIEVFNPSDCFNGTIQYAVANPVPNTIYEWSFGGDAKPSIVSGPTASVIYSQPGNKKVILTVDGLSYTYSNYIGLASPGYFPKISLPNNGQTLYCQNESITFSSLVTRSNVAAQADVTQYDWILTRPNGSIDNVSNTSASYPASGSLVLSDTGTYKLKLRVRTNCCGFSDYDSATVRVVRSFDKPIINLIRLQNETCAGVAVTYQLNLIPPTTPDGSPYQIFWSVDGVLVPSNNGQTSLTVDPAQGFNTTKDVSVVVGSTFPCLTLIGPGDWDPSSSTSTTSFPVVVLPGVTIAPSPALDNTNIVATNGLCNGLIDNVLLGTPSVVNFSVTQGAFPVQATIRYGVELGGGQFTFFSQDNTIIFDGNPVTFDELFGSPGNYIVEVTLVDAKGCTFTCYRRAVVEPIDQLPAIDFSITSPANPTPNVENVVEACGEAKIRVTGRVIGDVGTVPVAYFFDFGNGQFDTLPPTPNQTSYTTPEMTYGQGIYSIQTRIWIGTQLYSSIKQNLVKVYENPKASIVELARDNCEGRPRKLAGSDENTANYLWDLGDGRTSTQPVVDFTRPPGIYTVGLKVTNFNGLCSAETTATVVIEPRPIPAIAATEPIKACRQVRLQTENISSGNGGNLEFSSVDLGDQTLLEDPTTIDHLYSVPGRYSITIKARNASGCDSTVVLKDFITVFEQSEALFTPLAEFDTLIADSGIYVLEPPISQVIFRNESRGYSTFEWSINGELLTNVESPTREFTETGDYPIRLITRSKDGCPDTAYAIIRIRESNVFEVPNVFSPNADNINDLFEIKNIGWDYDFVVYNRWGNQIFVGNQDKIWDGTVNNGGQKCQEGVYIYYIKAKFRKNRLRTLEKSGSITLIR